MKRSLIIAIFAIMLAACGKQKQGVDSSASAPTDVANGSSGNVSLLVAEYLPGSGTSDPQILVRYRFHNGALIAREEILKSPNSEITYNSDFNRTYLNRYAITRWGSIVDIMDRKIIHKGNAELIACEGNQVIIERNHVDDRGIYVYDLTRKEYSRMLHPGKWKLTRPNEHSKALLSPDGTKSICGRDKIELHTLAGKTEVLATDLDYVDNSYNFHGGLPMLWLNNEMILSQRTNGELIVVGLDKTVSALVKIPFKNNSPAISLGLYRDPEGRIVYYHCDRHHVIDVDNRSYSPLEWHKIGNDFDIEESHDYRAACAIRYQGKTIGREQVEVYSAKTIKNHFASAYAPEGENLGQPRGVKVWSALSKEWTTIELGWFADVIGWIED